jgi:hypothetical protein
MIVKLSFVRLIQATLKQQVWLRRALIYHKSFIDIDNFLRSLYGLFVFAFWRSDQERNDEYFGLP